MHANDRFVYLPSVCGFSVNFIQFLVHYFDTHRTAWTRSFFYLINLHKYVYFHTLLHRLAIKLVNIEMQTIYRLILYIFYGATISNCLLDSTNELTNICIYELLPSIDYSHPILSSLVSSVQS